MCAVPPTLAVRPGFELNIDAAGSRAEGHHRSSSTCNTHRFTSDREAESPQRGRNSRDFDEQIAGQTVSDRATPGVTYYTSTNVAHPDVQSRNSH